MKWRSGGPKAKGGACLVCAKKATSARSGFCAVCWRRVQNAVRRANYDRVHHPERADESFQDYRARRLAYLGRRGQD